MAAKASWIECVRDQLAQRGFGKDRADEIETRLKNLSDRYARAGDPDPNTRATREIMSQIQRATEQKSREAVQTMEKIAETSERIERNLNSGQLRKFGKQGLAPIAESYFDVDPRINSTGAGNLRYNEQLNQERLWRIGNEIATKTGKSYWGTQRGKAYLPDIVREVFGEESHDPVAKSLAQAWTKMSDAGVDLLNQAGGAMDKLDRYLPQAWAPAKIFAAGQDAYTNFHLQALDWSRMTHPDGSPIAPEERTQYLHDVYQTIIQDGANKLDATSAGAGRGSNVANMLDNHRQLHYKDADSWLKAHADYGDGTIFDVMQRHISGQARQIALVQTFGPNPTMGIARIRAQLLRAAADHDATDAHLVRQTQAALDSSMGYEAQARAVTQQAPMNPYSATGTIVPVTASVLRAAQLGSSFLVSAPGDLQNMLQRRILSGHKANLLGGMGDYLRTFAEPFGGKKLEGVYARLGFVHDDMLNGIWEQNTRFSNPLGGKTPGIANGISGSVWRASMQSAHDIGIRRAILNEQMGFLHDTRGKSFDQLPEAWAAIMSRYGISPEDWDAFRMNCPETFLGKKAAWLAPISMLDTDHPNKEALFQKFGNMMHGESYFQFQDRPLVRLQAWTSSVRADSLIGALASSGLMYKSFPLTLAMTFGRLATSETSSGTGKLAYMGGLIASLALAGAVVNQAKNLTQGKDAEDVRSSGFWTRALLSGGGFGIVGDALRASTQDNGAGINDVTVGPLASIGGKAVNTGFMWSQVLGGELGGGDWTKTGKKQTTAGMAGAQTLKLGESVLPGSSLWYARLAIQRYAFDRLELLISPDGYKSQQTRINNAKKNGSPFWWRPGQATPDRMPEYQ